MVVVKSLWVSVDNLLLEVRLRLWLLVEGDGDRDIEHLGWVVRLVGGSKIGTIL